MVRSSYCGKLRQNTAFFPLSSVFDNVLTPKQHFGILDARYTKFLFIIQSRNLEEVD